MSTEHKPKKKRSPAYPGYSLDQVVEKALRLYEIENEHWTPLEALAEHWGQKPTNSSFQMYLSAAKQYGLLEEQTVATGRQFRIAPLTADLALFPKDSPGAIDRLQTAALKPRINKEIWEKYGGTLPSDQTLKVYLVRERPEGTFNPSQVDGFISTFHKTIEVAKFGHRGTIGKKEGNGDQSAITTGSLVQWTLQGVGQFSPPRKVLGVSQDGKYAFVEGMECGLPMTELTEQVCSPTTTMLPATTTSPPTSPFFKPQRAEEESPPADSAKERLTLDEGPVVLTWPANLSQESVYDLEGWLKVVVRRARRKAGIKDEEPR